MKIKRRIWFIAPFLISIWFFIIFQLKSSIKYPKQIKIGFEKTIRNEMVNIDYFRVFYKNSIKDTNKEMEGENGTEVNNKPSEKAEEDLRFLMHKFNELASSKISFLRKLPEKRRDNCFTRQYPLDLPTASIIIIYHNEAFSTLVRTVHTALSRSPYHLIKEVILVDDYSDYGKFPYLLTDLDEHFKNNYKVKIIRSQHRIGLTVARLIGARNSTGDVLVFLDSHCESFNGWLEPLLADIKQNPKIAVTPFIEAINWENFKIENGIIHNMPIGSFTWSGDFTWYYPPNQDEKEIMFKSPTMAGGLFAIDRQFFFDVGGYDEGMTYWGGENIEMSFRLWMCAEGIYSDSCSIVGHVFRKQSPHVIPNNVVLYNTQRAVEVWMDEYKTLVYNRLGIPGYSLEAGDISSRINLRKALKCKSFKWYLQNVCPHVRIPGSITQIKSEINNLCFDSGNKGNEAAMILYHCHGRAGTQAFEVNSKLRAIIHKENCLDLVFNNSKFIPKLTKCDFTADTQKWNFTTNKQIQHSKNGNCLQMKESGILEIAKCNSSNLNQKWEFSYSKSLIK